jgi:hypothetical protein
MKLEKLERLKWSWESLTRSQPSSLTVDSGIFARKSR